MASTFSLWDKAAITAQVSKPELVGVKEQPLHCWERTELPHKGTNMEERDVPHSTAKGSAP